MAKTKDTRPIAEILKEYIDRDGRLCGPGGEMTGKDINLLMGALDGTLDNFCVFSNGGGRPFMIWSAELIGSKSIDSFSDFVEKEILEYQYMYKIRGKETVVRQLP